MALINYYKILKRRKRLIIFLFLFSVIISGIISLFLPKIYRAEATIIILQDTDGLHIPKENFPDILKSRALAEKVINKLDLLNIYKMRQKNLKRWQLIRQLQKRIKIEDNKRGIIRIHYEDKSSPLAVKIVNAYIDALQEFNQNTWKSLAKKRRVFIEEQLKKAELSLKKAEERLQNFQKNNKRVFLTLGAWENIEKMAELEGQKIATEIALKEVEERIRSSKDLLYQQPKTEVHTKTITDNPVVSKLRLQLVEYELELESKKRSLSADDEDIISLKDKIAKTKEKIDREVEKIISSQTVAINPIYEELKKEIISQEIEKMALKARRDTLNQILFSHLPEKGLQLARLIREAKVQERWYSLLRDEHQRLRMAEYKKEIGFKVLDKAIPPKEKYKPKIRLNITIAGVLGLFGGIFLALFLEYFENRR